MPIHPSTGPRGDAPESERTVFEALRSGLPEGWEAWHSVRVRGHDRVLYEADFVVASPSLGMLILEVKGGRLRIDDGDWYRDGKRLDKSPLWQAQGVAHALARELERRGAAPPPFGAGVVLSDTSFSHGPKGGGLDGAVLGEQDLPYLEHALPGVYAAVVPSRSLPRSRRWIECLHEIWGANWVPELLGLRDRASAVERRLLRLTEDQIEKLELVLESPRQLVYGAAGSGKTVLARELCLRRAAEGQRVLYLCFTRALGSALRSEFEGREEEGIAGDGDVREGAARGVSARNVRQLAYETLQQCGCPTRPDENAFWEECSFEAAAAIERSPHVQRYDLVVIDEAQDFSPADWSLVEALVREGAHLWAFADERQRFWGERAIPPALFEHSGTMRLKGQHRNPLEIERFARRYCSDDGHGFVAEATNEIEPPGDKDVLALVTADASMRRDKVARLVERWRSQGARPEEIAVVALAGQTRSAIVGSGRLGDDECVSADDAAAGRSVVADTFLRFKGFERPFVVVTELGAAGERSAYDTRMYIALTRATVQAVVVATDDELSGDARLAVLPRRG